MNRILILILSWWTLALTGCAGPTTPFGALNGFGTVAGKIAKELGLTHSGATVQFYPHRQFLHDQSVFEIYVHDTRGIPDNFQLTLNYNGLDLSKKFLSSAEWTWMDLTHRRLRLATKHLRLRSDSSHDIQVIYRRTPKADPVIAEYLPPTCETFSTDRRLASVPMFPTSKEVIRTINNQADAKKFNPYLVAGLIAGESGFDPTAVSGNKAIGLTQITSIGEAEVIKSKGNWPRYPGIDDMSLLNLKLNIYRGNINEENEWRLNPMYSIEGGVTYLSYLSDYWNKPDKKALIGKALEKTSVPTEILLASYNSGPARVSRALERGGGDWLQDEELGEARKYVRKVVSYCDHFVNKED